MGRRPSRGRRPAGPIATAAVFGGNSDIARATIEALAADRSLRHVVLAVRDPVGAPGLHALRDRGLRVDTIAFDADDPEQHAHAVDAAFDRLGEIDLALVAFAVLGDQQRAKRDAAAAVTLARTNFVGAVSVLTVLAARMRGQGRGTIVVLSSVAAERARRANYPYGATKAGLDAFAQGLGDELAGDGVHVMVVRPGFVRTKMTAGLAPAPLATDPPRIAAAIVAGLRRGAHTVWAPRVMRPAAALMRLLPRSLWRRIRR